MQTLFDAVFFSCNGCNIMRFFYLCGGQNQDSMEKQRGEEPPPSQANSAGDRLGDFGTKEGCAASAGLLVPTDFTEESGYALKHAQRIGRAMDRSVALMHVLGDEERESEVQEKLQEQAEEVCGRGSDEIILRVERGVVSERVPAVARELGAEYIILGSRDVKNPVQYKRSTSLKLLGIGSTPYITLQQSSSVRSYEDIVLPIDYTDESEKRYDWMDRLSSYFSPTFHIIRPEVNELELEEQVDENVANAMAQLTQRGIPYTVRTVPGEAEYALEIIQIAREIEADLIVLVTSNDPRKKGTFMLEPHERRLVLEAAEIPVMTVNPK